MSLLTLLPCRCKGGISQYPQFVLRLRRNWIMSQRIAQCMMTKMTQMLDTNETCVWIMRDQTCCSARRPCNVWSGAQRNPAYTSRSMTTSKSWKQPVQNGNRTLRRYIQRHQKGDRQPENITLSYSPARQPSTWLSQMPQPSRSLLQA